MNGNKARFLRVHGVIVNSYASVLPMQRPEAGRPWLLEICPASPLKREGLEMPYMGRQAEHRENRAAILSRLAGAGRVQINSAELRAQLVEDRGGDALDAVIAAYATGRALREADRLLTDDPVYGVEGLVYV